MLRLSITSLANGTHTALVHSANGGLYQAELNIRKVGGQYLLEVGEFLPLDNRVPVDRPKRPKARAVPINPHVQETVRDLVNEYRLTSANLQCGRGVTWTKVLDFIKEETTTVPELTQDRLAARAAELLNELKGCS